MVTLASQGKASRQPEMEVEVAATNMDGVKALMRGFKARAAEVFKAA